jgi:hypothetical protein
MFSLCAGEAAGDFPGLRRGAAGFSTCGGAANPVKMFHDGASIRERMTKAKHRSSSCKREMFTGEVML